MQTLNVNDAGFSYIFKCVGYYGEGTVYLLLYLVSLTLIAVKGGKKERLIFLPQAAVMLLTFFNPVFPVVLNHFFDVNKEYYRFFWMLPVITAVSFEAVNIVFDLSKNAARAVVASLILVCIFGTAGNFIYEDGYGRIENLYQMPGELLQVCDIIHKDSKDAFPKAMAEYDYSMQIRQYDASILLACDREQYIDAVTKGVDHDSLMSDEDYVSRLLAVVGCGVRTDPGAFLEGLEETDTEYVIITKGGDIDDFCREAGLLNVGQTANHVVYRYLQKEKTEFEPADYSDVWAMQRLFKK
ncbi:MAG: hypothetical protein K6F86_10115 [Lachnospiraceae bacterium]|nr:hypothetical protein [Lachnospiraceae bacterium]